MSMLNHSKVLQGGLLVSGLVATAIGATILVVPHPFYAT
jgi:hypothetical protein